jgi:CRP-like cAMP-binding protein
MKRVGHPCQTLLAPVGLRKALVEIGKSEHFQSQSILFQAGDQNAGVFLVCAGLVCLEVPGVPQLSRAFSAGSILGLPSTFSERPYNLTAASATDSDLVHVSKKKFLDLMKAQPDLCRQATDILSREVAFILSALRGQPAPAVPDATIVRLRRATRLQVVSK